MAPKKKERGTSPPPRSPALSLVSPRPGAEKIRNQLLLGLGAQPADFAGRNLAFHFTDSQIRKFAMDKGMVVSAVDSAFASSAPPFKADDICAWMAIQPRLGHSYNAYDWPRRRRDPEDERWRLCWQLAAVIEFRSALNAGKDAQHLQLEWKRLDEALKDSLGTLLQHAAARVGDMRVAEALLDLGADVNQVEVNCLTPIAAAADYDRKHLVRMYASRGAHLNPSDAIEPIWEAVERGNDTMVSLLVELKANPNVVYEMEDSVTPLLTAAKMGHHAVVSSLLQMGADPNQLDDWGTSPVAVAADEGNASMIRELVAFGADIHQGDVADWLPIHKSCRYGHVDALRELVELGADVNAADCNGITPAIVAGENGHTMIIRRLKHLGANLDIMDDRGHTVLSIAAQSGRVDVVKVCAELGADVDHRGRMGYGVDVPVVSAARARYASRDRYEGVITTLVEAGCRGATHPKLLDYKSTIEQALQCRHGPALRAAVSEAVNGRLGEPYLSVVVAAYAARTFEEWQLSEPDAN